MACRPTAVGDHDTRDMPPDLAEHRDIDPVRKSTPFVSNTRSKPASLNGVGTEAALHRSFLDEKSRQEHAPTSLWRKVRDQSSHISAKLAPRRDSLSTSNRQSLQFQGGDQVFSIHAGDKARRRTSSRRGACRYEFHSLDEANASSKTRFTFTFAIETGHFRNDVLHFPSDSFILSR